MAGLGATACGLRNGKYMDWLGTCHNIPFRPFGTPIRVRAVRRGGGGEGARFLPGIYITLPWDNGSSARSEQRGALCYIGQAMTRPYSVGRDWPDGIIKSMSRPN